MQFIHSLKKNLKALVVEEGGQDGFEYLLVIGGVSVVVVGAIATGGLGGVAGALTDGVCGAINTVMNPDITCP
jgi:hypothetical protein